MKISETALQGVYIAQSEPHGDDRGAFLRCFCDQELDSLLAGRQICQINHSLTTSVGAVRGLHFQRQPYAEMKLIRCLRGKVWDVAVDLRPNSPTYLKWHAEELTPSNGKLYVIPEGCAHGFQVLEPNSELLYLHTAPYTPEVEGGVAWDEPRFAIKWPLPPLDLSRRDQNHDKLTSDFQGVVV